MKKAGTPKKNTLVHDKIERELWKLSHSKLFGHGSVSGVSCTVVVHTPLLPSLQLVYVSTSVSITRGRRVAHCLGCSLFH